MRGKFKHQKLPLRICNSPDISQEKMNELFNGLEYVRAYIGDLLIISNGNFEDHLNKVKIVLKNEEKSFFAGDNLKYLGFLITREGITPLSD